MYTYKIIILPVVFHVCKTYSLTSWEVHSLRTFENRELRRISVCKREEVTEGWIKSNSEKVNYLCCSPDIIGMIKSRTI
jgi:hypothetical protein